MSDMSLLPVGSGMGSDALAAAGGAFVGGLFGNLTKNQAIETASRMVALVSLVSAGSSMPDVR